MKKSIKFILFILTVVMVCAFSLTACFDNDDTQNEPNNGTTQTQPDNTDNGSNDETSDEFTVTFDSNGGSTVEAKKVKSGEKAVKPANPIRDGYNFVCWLLDNKEYDFDTAVTGNITLTAQWIDATVTLLETALAADYSCVTVAQSVAEYENSVSTATVNKTFKRSANSAFYTEEGKERAMTLDGDGNVVKGYWRDKIQGEWTEWKRNTTVTPAAQKQYYTIDLKFGEFEPEEFTYDDGKYYLIGESEMWAAQYLFGTSDYYIRNVWLRVKDGAVSEMGGESFDDDTPENKLVFSQTLSDVGSTSVQVPSIPVTVRILTSDASVTEGTALDPYALFCIIVDGQPIVTPQNAVDFGNLNPENPTVGTYPITLNYIDEDGNPHTESVTVTVTARQVSTETFATIFAKDYTNATIANGSAIAKRDGDVYVSGNRLFYYIEADNSLTKYTATNPDSISTSANQTIPQRIDLIFALSSDLFTKSSEEENVYSVSNNDAIIDALKGYISKTNVFCDNEDYSVTIKTEGGFVKEITYQFKYKLTAAAKTPMSKNVTLTIGGVGTTEFTEDETTALQKVEEMRKSA